MNGTLNDYRPCAKKPKLTQSNSIITNKKPLITQDMSRGKNCDAEEGEALVKVWIQTIEDPVVGTHHTRKVFFYSMDLWLIALNTYNSSDMNVLYGSHAAVSINQHFVDLSADIQKFRNSLARARASKRTSVSD